MRKRWWLLFFLGVLVLGLAACSGDREPEAGPSDSEPAVTEEVTETTPAGPTAIVEEGPEEAPSPMATEEEPGTPQTPAAEGEPEAGPMAPEGAFGGAEEALAQLKSYRYSTEFTFVSEEGGQVESGSIELTGVIAGPNRKHLIWRDLEEDEEFEIIQIEDRAWILDEEGWQEAPVMVAEAMSQAVLVYAPSVAWGGIFGELEPSATYVGDETINGVSAHHYTSTYAQWGGYWSGNLENASGDVWIAEAGYPLRYRFTASGIDEDGNRGTVTWRMDLTDVNADITIEAPTPSADAEGTS